MIFNSSTLAIEIVVLACAAGCATLVAVTVVALAGMLAGAVNIPAPVILPALADQVTAELLVLVTVAANCCFPPGAIAGLSGETCTVTVEFVVFWGAPEFCVNELQATANRRQLQTVASRSVRLQLACLRKKRNGSTGIVNIPRKKIGGPRVRVLVVDSRARGRNGTDSRRQ
jgi:hypothetical protein